MRAMPGSARHCSHFARSNKLFTSCHSGLTSKRCYHIAAIGLEKLLLILARGMEDQMREIQVDELPGELDMIFRAGRDTARLLDRFGRDNLAVFRRHLRAVNFLVKQR